MYSLVLCKVTPRITGRGDHLLSKSGHAALTHSDSRLLYVSSPIRVPAGTNHRRSRAGE